MRNSVASRCIVVGLLGAAGTASAFAPSLGATYSQRSCSLPRSREAMLLAGAEGPTASLLSAVAEASPAALELPSVLVADVGGTIGAIFALFLAVIAGLALTGNLEAASVPLLLATMGGDPEKRREANAGENDFIKWALLEITPSAWKKAYLGEVDVEGEEQELLDLPAWQGEDARSLVEPEAVACVQALQLEAIDVPSVGPVDTCFWSLAPEGEPANAPPIVLVHGFDSSVLEFRYVVPQLLAAGFRVEAMDWWTGGFTDRTPFLQAIEAGAKPWDLIREHQRAFIKRRLGTEKVILLGASLGGAVALDFAAEHPEAVEALVLMDAGGESYAQPPPALTALAADPVTNLFQFRADNGLLPYPQVWYKMADWNQALRAYLKSGGYQQKVNPDLIRGVTPPTLVMWGEEDDVLPIEDAYKYQEDLPDCVGVQIIPAAQHAPALENPEFVGKTVVDFVTRTAEGAWREPRGSPGRTFPGTTPSSVQTPAAI